MVIKEGYKQTEIGVIPMDWEVKSIKGITIDMLQGVNTAIDIPEYVESGYPILKANNIIDREVNFSTSDHISVKTYQGYNDRFKIKKDDFLFSNIGARLGTGSLMKTNTECSFAWNVMRIIPNQKLVKPEFLSCIMNSPALFIEIKKNESGSGMGFVPKNVLQNLTFPLPPSLAEQTAIATALSDADGLITGLEKLITKKRNIKQGAMQQLLQPKDGWMNNEIGNVFQFRQGVQCAIEKQSTEDSIGLKRFIRIVDLSQTKEIPRYINDPGLSHHIKKTDLFMVRYGNPGLLGYGYDGVIANNLFRLIPKIRIESNFFYYLLYSKNEDILQLSSSTTMAALNFTSLKILKLDYPKSLAEQTRIATILSDMDAELSALEQKLEKYKKVKLGMMQELLTGKTRLV